MISKVDIEKIPERNAVPDSPVLSVYLEVDQSKASNLSHQFEVSLKDMLRPIEATLDQKPLKSFSADAGRVEQFISDFEPRAKGLILFADDSENFLWVREGKAPIQNHARWSDNSRPSEFLRRSMRRSPGRD